MASLLSRFFTPNWSDYLATGALETGVPQPEGGLLGLLQSNLFQTAVGRYGILPQQQWMSQPNQTVPMPETRQVPVLGLPGGGAAYGYIDPKWKFDTTFTTSMVPMLTQVLQQQRKKKGAAAPTWVPPREYPTPNHPNNPGSPNWNPGWKDM